MWMMLQQDMPEDFVISTGETHTVRDFVNASAKALEMDIVWEGKGLDEVAKDRDGKIILKINKDFYRPNEVNALLGDSTKAKNILGWDPEIKFEELVAMMAKFDFEDLKEERSS